MDPRMETLAILANALSSAGAGLFRTPISRKGANGYMLTLPIEGGDSIIVPSRYIMSGHMLLSKKQLTFIYLRENPEILNEIFSSSKPDGNHVMLLELVFNGECINRSSIHSEKTSTYNTACCYSSTRRAVHPRQTKNYDKDPITLERFEDMSNKNYIVLCISSGETSTYFCIAKSTIVKVYDMALVGENLYRLCVTDHTETYAVNSSIYAILHIEYPVYIDIISLYRLRCLMDIIDSLAEGEYITAYIELMSIGRSLIHVDSVSNENRLHWLGRATVCNETSQKEIPLKIGEDLKLKMS